MVSLSSEPLGVGPC